MDKWQTPPFGQAAQARSSDDVLRMLARKATLDRLLLVVAHPDDDVIGAGALLLDLRTEAHVAYVTNGSPQNPEWAERAGFASAEAYASVRRSEAEQALTIAGIPPARMHWFGISDQQASFALAATARRLHALLQTLQPEIVLTHPFEGGHPDHDATAFIVHAARDLLVRRGSAAPAVLEFTSYHAGATGPDVGGFLKAGSTPEIRIELDDEHRAKKQQMLDIHRTQSRVIRDFGFTTDRERFRVAPSYDFRNPPHKELLYERFLPGFTGEQWLALSRAALDELARTQG